MFNLFLRNREIGTLIVSCILGFSSFVIFKHHDNKLFLEQFEKDSTILSEQIKYNYNQYNNILNNLTIITNNTTELKNYFNVVQRKNNLIGIYYKNKGYYYYTGSKFMTYQNINSNQPSIESNNNFLKYYKNYVIIEKHDDSEILGIVVDKEKYFYNNNNNKLLDYLNYDLKYNNKLIYKNYDGSLNNDIYYSNQLKFQEEDISIVIHPNSKTVFNVSSDESILYAFLIGLFSYMLMWFLLNVLEQSNKSKLKAITSANEYQYLKWFDPITDLYKQPKLISEFMLKIETRESDIVSYIISLDIKNFKMINDTYGKEIGDKLLRECADKLKKKFDNSLIARTGGDEFTIIIDKKNNNNNYLLDLENIMVDIKKLEADFYIANQDPLKLKFNIGISLYPLDATDITELIEYSEMSMYEAKKKEDSVFIYKKELIEEVFYINKVKKELPDALANNELYIVLQPKVKIENNIETRRSAEVLCRWKNKKLGQIYPDTFIPLAENTGEIHSIGLWVFEESLKVIKDFKEKGKDINLSVNVSPKQLSKSELPKLYKMLLEKYGVSANQISLELTESNALHQGSKNILKEFSDMGFSISIDDFGKGYSSLSYIIDYSINQIKLDKSFIDNILTNKINQIIMKSIMTFSRELNIDLILEGVETKEQADYLIELGCSEFQGYYYSRPLIVEDFEKYIWN